MPGYSREAINSNYRNLVNAGIPAKRAISEAISAARVIYFQKHPHGALPEYLQFPKGRRLREHYDRFGKPIAELRRENPAPRSKRKLRVTAEVQRAANLYHDFTGHTDLKAQKMTVPPLPKSALAFGYCDGVMYSTVRDGKAEKYVHRFAKDSRPLLCSSPDGKQLYMLGGAYDFTERGIVDKKTRRK